LHVLIRPLNTVINGENGSEEPTGCTAGLQIIVYRKRLVNAHLRRVFRYNRTMTNAIRRVRRTKPEAQAAYNRLSRWYDLLSGSSEARPRQAGLALLKAQPGEIILDTGPGTGHSLAALAHAVGKTGYVHGLDLSPGMLAVSRLRLQKTGIGASAAEVSLVCGDALHLPYPAGAFDAVFSSFNLELFDTPEIPRVLEECRRVMRPGGRI
jgi:ubiquinone/menaquinone biosynthesis C-methylase UbiE